MSHSHFKIQRITQRSTKDRKLNNWDLQEWSILLLFWTVTLGIVITCSSFAYSCMFELLFSPSQLSLCFSCDHSFTHYLIMTLKIRRDTVCLCFLSRFNARLLHNCHWKWVLYLDVSDYSNFWEINYVWWNASNVSFVSWCLSKKVAFILLS